MAAIKADVAYSNANVKLVGQSPGVAYGELGPTHHSIEDLGWLRLLPNIAILVPADPWETAAAVKAAVKQKYGWQFTMVEVTGTLRGWFKKSTAADCAIALQLTP